MGTMGVDTVFIDTNILVYAQQSYSPFHQTATNALQQLATVGTSLCMSRQILREYLAVMSRSNLVNGQTSQSVLVRDVVLFETQFLIAEDGPLVTQQLLQLLTTIPCAGKQVHDANIVATMLTHGVTTLLTHNVVDFQRFGSLITIMSL